MDPNLHYRRHIIQDWPENEALQFNGAAEIPADEALFLTSVQLKDKDLTPLADCPNLRHLSCARFAPRKNFDALKALRPDIECSWFDRYDI